MGSSPEDWSVPRKKSVPSEAGHFGQRLAALRRDGGFTQRSLATASGISHRMIAYYEGRDSLPPGHVLATLAETLDLSVDELTGAGKATKKSNGKSNGRPKVNRHILRRIQQMEKLPSRDKRELLSIIDTYLERYRLAQRS